MIFIDFHYYLIDLKGNFIDRSGISELDNVLDNNESLVSVDCRENEGFTA